MTAVKRKTNKSTQSSPTEEATKRNRREKEPLFTWRRLLGRGLVSLLLVGAVYFATSRKSHEKILAKQDEVIQRRSFRVLCSSDYDAEKERLRGCLPKICGRVVTDQLLTDDETKNLLRLAKKGFALGGSDGGAIITRFNPCHVVSSTYNGGRASIFDLHSGSLSQGQEFVNIYKLEQGMNVVTEKDRELVRGVTEKIRHLVAMEFGAAPAEIYLTHPSFFSHMTANPPKTLHDEYWHPQVDKETYESFHYTSLVYLSDYGKDFNGGQFVFLDKEANVTVEPKSGRVSMFTSGSENRHHVNEVAGGNRYALTIAFTCEKKHAVVI